MSQNNSSGTDVSTVEAHFEWEETERVPVAVVEAVASVTDQDPTRMEPLSQVVDTDALDALFAPTDSTPRRVGAVEFSYQGCLVSVSATGTVSVVPPTDRQQL